MSKRLNDSFTARRINCVKGEIALSGDKSVAHRSIILSALSQGKTKIKNFPFNKDCLFTLKVFQKLGVKITRSHSAINVSGKGLFGLKKPRGPIFVGNSGTTLRLVLGVLAGQDFEVKLVIGRSLSQRPMRRVTEPLRLMGARINSKFKMRNSKIIEEYPPITIQGGALRAITYKMPVASAQVKSAILLAALYTKGKTCVIEPIPTRDHTERMLGLFKADIKLQQNKIVIKGKRKLISPGKIFIPGDISSAAFFMVLAAMLPDSQILMNNVSLNPSRTGIIRVLERMGADIQVSSIKHQASSTLEPMGEILVRSSRFKGTIVKRAEIPFLIDELPILMVAASLAKGKTVFAGVGELRVKETDRIRSMSENLTKMGANIRVTKEGKIENIIITGVKQLKGTKVRTFGDHRTAMSMVIAGLVAAGQTQIDDISCINKSFPNFINILKSLTTQ